jgi:hypothetical protein
MACRAAGGGQVTADIQAQVAETRLRQGLPATIEDAVLLSQLAAAILADELAAKGDAAA